MKTHGKNIGKALGMVERFWLGCDIDEDFAQAMGAPMGELRGLINRSQARGFRKVKALVKATTGLRWRAFCREVERRTSARFVHHSTSLGREEGLHIF